MDVVVKVFTPFYSLVFEFINNNFSICSIITPKGIQLNNWKAIDYIFLGFGSVFIGYSLAFFVMMALTPPFPNFVPNALAAQTPWFILAALMYVVGIVGYFAGKEKELNESGKPKKRDFSRKIPPIWSFPIAAIAFAFSYVALAISYLENDFQLLDNVIIPMLWSLAIGSIVGLLALLLFFKINDE